MMQTCHIKHVITIICIQMQSCIVTFSWFGEIQSLQNLVYLKFDRPVNVDSAALVITFEF